MKPKTLSWMMLSAVAALPLPGRGADAVMGAYEGVYHADRTQNTKATASVIAEGPGYYRVVIRAEPLSPGDATMQFEVYGVQQGSGVNLFGRANAQRWQGSITGDKLTASPGYYGMGLELAKVVRKSPAEGAAAPDGAVQLIPYTAGQPPVVTAWNGGAWKPQADGSLQCEPGKGSITTKQSFGDMKLHLEFWLPLMAEAFGQGRANSGVIINNMYEVQVLDSFGLVPAMGDCGSIYDQTRPRVNASFPPETWQTYDIVFRAPRMNADGTVKEKARITVDLNGVRIHQNATIEGATAGHEPGKPPANVATGPLQLQDHGNRVRYRNVWLQELKDAQP